MEFTLRFLLLTFLLVALCFALFDWPGLAIGLAVTGVAVCARGTKTRKWATISVVLMLVIGFLLLVPAARRAARRVAAVQLESGISQVAMALWNYHDRFGCLPPVQERDSQDAPRHSWRVLILQGQVLEGYGQVLASPYNRDEAWNGPNNRKVEAKSLPRTSVAVVGEDGDWLRPTADSNPVLVVEVWKRSIPWIEPRDLTVNEACAAIHIPMPSGCLARRIGAEELAGVRAVFADGTGLQIPAHTPLPVLRAALLGDRSKQRELESYRGVFRRLRWFDYLTLVGLVACWVAMTRPRPRGRPARAGEEDMGAPHPEL